MKSPEKIIQHIVDWLNAYLAQSHQKGFVVGISGGIDSAVTSTLCALTQKPVLCLEMPIHQDPSQVSRAQQHIEWLTKKYPNVEGKTISLTSVFDTFQNQLPPTEKADQHLLSLANTRARLRMSTLYYFAALEHYLVAGTGNKVEDFGVGFYTKYGDGGVDIAPIADCSKTEVWELATYLGISKDIIDADPTDGLWDDGRTDVNQLGMTYQELEAAMSSKKDKNYEKYMQIRKKNLHKMEPIPVCKFKKK